MLKIFNRITVSVISFGATAAIVCVNKNVPVLEKVLTLLVCGSALAFSLTIMAELFLYGCLKIYERLTGRNHI